MALANKKSSDIFNKKTGGDTDSKSISTQKETEIKNKFDNGEHIEDNGMFETLAPTLYAIQQLTEDIEELRRFVTSEITSITTSQANAIAANTAKTGISTSQASAITANTAKTGISASQASEITANTAKVSQGLNTANTTMQFDVTQVKGNYYLTITVVAGTGKAAVTKTVTLTLV